MSHACAKIWGKDFMPPETVAIIPSQGYVIEKKLVHEPDNFLLPVMESKSNTNFL